MAIVLLLAICLGPDAAIAQPSPVQTPPVQPPPLQTPPVQPPPLQAPPEPTPPGPTPPAPTPPGPTPPAPSPAPTAPAASEAADGGPTYWARDFSFQRVDIATVIARLRWVGIDVPVEAEGAVTVDATIWIPFGALANPTAYRLEGTLTSPRLRIESVVLDDARFRFRLIDGVLQITRAMATPLDTEADTAAGRIAAEGSAQLIPPGPLRVALQLQQVDLPYVLQRVGADQLQMTGQISGSVQMENQLRTAADWLGWSGQGSARVDDFQWQDRPAVQIAAERFQIAQGRITSDRLTVSGPGFQLAGSGMVDTTAAGDFRLQIAGNQVPLEDAIAWAAGAAAPQPTEGRLAVRMQIAGDLAPFTWQAQGTLQAPAASIAGIQFGPLAHHLLIDRDHLQMRLLDDAAEPVARAARIQQIDLRYQITDDAWQLTDLQAAVLGGQVSGSGRWMIGNQGQHAADLRWSNLAIDYALPAADAPPLRVHADTSGDLQWSVPVDRLRYPADHQLDAEVQLQRLTVNGRQIGQWTARADADDARWQASAEGTIFGGGSRLQLDAQMPADATWQDLLRPAPQAIMDEVAAADGSYRLQIDGATIPLTELLRGGGGAADGGAADGGTPLRLDVTVSGGLFPFDFDAQGTVRSGPLNAGGLDFGPLAHRFAIDQQRLRLQALPEAPARVAVRSLQADYNRTDGALRLNRLEGDVWGGRISGSAVWDPRPQGRHQADLTWTDLAFDLRLKNSPGARPARLHADTSGRVQWTVPSDQLHRPAAHQFAATARLQGLALDDRVLGDWTASARAESARWQLEARGALFDGTADLQLTAQIPPDAQWQEVLDFATPPTQAPATSAATAAPDGSYRLRIAGAAIPLDEVLGDTARDLVAGPLRLDASVIGGLFPWDFRAEGSVRSGPINAAGLTLGPLAHRFVVDAQRLVLQPLPDAGPTWAIQGVQAEYAIQPDAVRLNRLQGELWGGQLGGSLVWMTQPNGRHRAQVQWRDLRIDGRFPPAAASPRQLRFTTSGQLAWSAAADALDRPAAHRMDASARVDDLTIDGRTVGNVRLMVNGQSTQWAASADASLIGRPVALRLEASVADDATWRSLLASADGGAPPAAAGGAYRLQVQTTAFPVDQAIALVTGPDSAPEMVLAADLDLMVTGALSPVDWRVQGTARAPETTVVGLELGPLAHRLSLDDHSLLLEPLPGALPDSALGRLAAQYAADDQAWRLQQIDAELWGGQVAGHGQWAVAEQEQHQAQLRWSDLAVQGRVRLMGDEPTRLSAVTSGELHWSVPADAFDRPAAHQLQASLQMAQLTADAVPIGGLSASLNAASGRWRLRGDGDLLGGAAQLQLETTIPGQSDWQHVAAQTTDGSLPVSGMLDLRSVAASRLFALWQPAEHAGRWSGQLGLNWQLLEGEPADQRRSRLEISAQDLQYGQQRLTDRLTAQLLLIGDQAVVQSLTGSYAGGRIGATGRWGLGTSASQLSVFLAGIDARRAVLPISADLATVLSGFVGGRLLITDGDGLLVSGSLEMRDAAIGDLTVDNLRTHVTANLALPSLRWAIRMRDVRGRVASGRLSGQATIQSAAGGGDQFDLDSRWEMDGVDFQDLLDELGGGSRTFGRGVLTGTLTLSGRRIQSARDLRGELQASLSGSDATAIPGLTASQNYLGAFSLRNTRFDSGSIDGRISQGELQIRELWLVGDQLRVWGEGEVSLSSGRMDVDLVAATGNFQQANPLLLTLAQQVALDATLPVSLVLRANELLSDRVIRLQLYGTYRRPQVRINPIRNLGQNAARFFLRSIAGDLVPTAAAAAVGRER